jgi:dihydropyrimidine dehydrogenase (NAD+) subunit PreT
MKNLAPKLQADEYQKNFAELHPPLSSASAVSEANRCLFCYDSPCMKKCPTHIDISSFIKKIATDNLIGSVKTILSSNYVALTCAKACPVEVLCEGACVYNDKGEKPVEIGRLQRYVMDYYYSIGSPQIFEKKKANGKKIAIIGSGPAGLSCAAELSILGYEAVIFESSDIPGGLNTWGIAPYKLRKVDALNEVEMVKKLGAKLITSTKVGKDVSVESLLKDYDAVFLGVGLGDSTNLSIPGEGLEGVFGATEFIEKVKSEEWIDVPVGKRVAVIGGGNTSIDAATEAKRLGAEEVIIIYRRSSNDMSAYQHEYELAKRDGVIFYFFTAPTQIKGKRFVEGIECMMMQPSDKEDSRGKRMVKSMPGSEFVIPVDMVITAIGQHPNDSFVTAIPGLEINKGKIEVNENFQTGNLKVFAGGDCINGGKEVVNAAYDGKNAAKGIDLFLSGLVPNENQYLKYSTDIFNNKV